MLFVDWYTLNEYIYISLHPAPDYRWYYGIEFSPVTVDEILPTVKRLWFNASNQFLHNTNITLTYSMFIRYGTQEHELSKLGVSASILIIIASIVLVIKRGFQRWLSPRITE